MKAAGSAKTYSHYHNFAAELILHNYLRKSTMIKVSFTKHSLLKAVTVCLLVLVACKKSVMGEITPTLSQSASSTTEYFLPTQQLPQPDFINDLAPQPGSILSLQDFQDGAHANQAKWFGRLVDHSICVELNADPLLLPGDYFTSTDRMLERTQFVINDRVIDRPNWELDFIMETQLLDENGNVVAVSGGPYLFCWEGDLVAGLHTAEIEFRKTSGKVLRYQWSFVLQSD